MRTEKCILAGFGGQGVMLMGQLLAQAALEAVSYTHLDVYKRQDITQPVAGRAQHLVEPGVGLVGAGVVTLLEVGVGDEVGRVPHRHAGA